ncbi:MAG: DUF6265 family protein [Algoriphagus sp.]|nr:DUF6265 family protein [Algoriphagus sp.]
MKTLLIIPVLFLFATASFSQVKTLEKDQTPGKGKVEDLSWIEGVWAGTGLGGDCEEVWMPAVDGHMIGTFRFWEDGKLVFSEFMNIVQEGETFSMKLKHFNPDLSPWEENDKWTTFRLVEIGENFVSFSGLKMQRIGDEMILQLALTENGVRRIEEFKYKKKAF